MTAQDEKINDLEVRLSRRLIIEESSDGTGLANLGNTCYMNAALQCLLHTSELVWYILNNYHENEINHDNPLGTGGRLMTAFARLTTLIWKKIPKTVSAPRMREIRQAVIKISPQFDGYDQQDAQEFLAFLMDGLHEDINRVKQKIYFTEPDTDKNTVEKSKVRLERLAAESWQRHLLRNKSRLVDLFQGQLMSTVTCLTCKFYSLKFDPVMYLSLPVVRNDNQKPVKTLNEAFEAFSQDEELSSSNMWICPNCKNHQKAVKKIEIWILPPVLI
eukprot:GHVL01019997.1.p1 GENE.GHVL01019997.1~~GHVL01019997.1.p1  ORF type:complete len:274 (-),score=42.15 GHVL01019997.1:737-1558(-)